MREITDKTIGIQRTFCDGCQHIAGSSTEEPCASCMTTIKISNYKKEVSA